VIIKWRIKGANMEEEERLRKALLILQLKYAREKCPKERHKIYENIERIKELLGIDSKDIKEEYSVLITRW